MITKEENKVFMEMVEKCKCIMKDCGFELPTTEYRLSERMTSTLGYHEHDNKGKHLISIATYVFRGYIAINETKEIEQVILHEMCHALPKGSGHGEMWKRYVTKVNEKYGYNISRLKDNDESFNKVKTMSMDSVSIVCQKCNNVYVVNKKRNSAKHPENYHCKCGGRLSLQL